MVWKNRRSQIFGAGVEPEEMDMSILLPPGRSKFSRFWKGSKGASRFFLPTTTLKSVVGNKLLCKRNKTEFSMFINFTDAEVTTGLVSSFNGISTFVGYKGVHIFPKVLIPQVEIPLLLVLPPNLYLNIHDASFYLISLSVSPKILQLGSKVFGKTYGIFLNSFYSKIIGLVERLVRTKDNNLIKYVWTRNYTQTRARAHTLTYICMTRVEGIGIYIYIYIYHSPIWICVKLTSNVHKDRT